jgi:hypothetical protein
LTEGLDSTVDIQSTPHQALSLENLSLEAMENTISEDVVLGSLTGTGLEVVDSDPNRARAYHCTNAVVSLRYPRTSAQQPYLNQALSLENLSLEAMENTISEDVVLGSLTGTGLEVAECPRWSRAPLSKMPPPKELEPLQQQQ